MTPNNMAIDDLFKALRKCGLGKYIIIQDEETIKDLGSTSDQFMAVFYKGTLSEKILLAQ